MKSGGGVEVKGDKGTISNVKHFIISLTLLGRGGDEGVGVKGARVNKYCYTVVNT